MILVIAERSPADKQGPDISDPLITSTLAARERGRNEIDKNYSNRELVTAAGPLKGFIRPGHLVEVADSEQQVWRGMVTASAITIDADNDSFSAVINTTTERVAQ